MNKKIIIKLMLFVIFLLPTILIIEDIAVQQIHTYFVNSVINLTGLNKYLANIIIALLIIPMSIGTKWYFFSPFNKKRKYIGFTIITTMFIMYNFGLYKLTQNANFFFSDGNVLKWYANTPEGIIYHDNPGYDTKYGIKLLPVTPEIISNLEKKKMEMTPKLIEYSSYEDIEFFDSITGESKVWYYIDSSGNYELYDKAGFHYRYNEQLKPITKEIIKQLFQAEDNSEKEYNNTFSQIIKKAENQEAEKINEIINELTPEFDSKMVIDYLPCIEDKQITYLSKSTGDNFYKTLGKKIDLKFINDKNYIDLLKKSSDQELISKWANEKSEKYSDALMYCKVDTSPGLLIKIVFTVKVVYKNNNNNKAKKIYLKYLH